MKSTERKRRVEEEWRAEEVGRKRRVEEEKRK